MQPTNPFTKRTYKVNSYIIEAAARNGEIDLFHFWLFLRAIDLYINNHPTGLLFNILTIQRLAASKMCVSRKTVSRYIDRADRTGWINVDRTNDSIYITGRAPLAILMWMRDTGEISARDRSLPDIRTRHPLDTLEVSVTIPEVWTNESKVLSKSMALDVVRQRVSERGWGRESFARLTGTDRASSARVDRNTGVRRGWQYGAVTIASLSPRTAPGSAEELGKNIATASIKCGRGKKLWYGKTRAGQPALFFQLPIKWDTRFSGRLKYDVDVTALAKSSITEVSMGRCWSPHPVVTHDGRDAASRCGSISDATRIDVLHLIGQLLRRTTQTSSTLPNSIDINVIDNITWSNHKSWTALPPNIEFTKSKLENNRMKMHKYENLLVG